LRRPLAARHWSGVIILRSQQIASPDKAPNRRAQLSKTDIFQGIEIRRFAQPVEKRRVARYRKTIEELFCRETMFGSVLNCQINESFQILYLHFGVTHIFWFTL
jgi:hypothetical protein